MNEEHRKNFRQHAHAIGDLLALNEKEVRWLYPLLNRSIQSSLKLIWKIQERPHTYEELARDLGMNANSVKQRISDLIDVGVDIKIHAGDACSMPQGGRPRSLIRG